MQNVSLLQTIIFAIPILLLAGALFLFARAFGNRRPIEQGIAERTTNVRPASVPSDALPVGGDAAPVVTTRTAPADGSSGFRGWLVVVAIGVVLSPIATIIGLVQTGNIERATSGKFHLMYAASVGLYLALFVLQICTAIFMARRARQFVSFYIATTIAMILFEPVGFLLSTELAALIVGTSLQEVLQQYSWDNDDLTNIMRWIPTSISLVIWMIYVIRSRRVANTFVK